MEFLQLSRSFRKIDAIFFNKTSHNIDKSQLLARNGNKQDVVQICSRPGGHLFDIKYIANIHVLYGESEIL